MFPSPSDVKQHSSPKAKKIQEPAPPPFIAPPSRLIHDCPTLNKHANPRSCDHNGISSPHTPAYAAATAANPFTTLLLSHHLAQKNHHLILVSRQIEALAREWFTRAVQEADVERRMSHLEERYNKLRQDVECELESAWVNADFLPVDMAGFSASRKTPESASTKPFTPQIGLLSSDGAFNSTYIVDRALKRKRDEEEHSRRKKHKQEQDDDYKSSDEAVDFTLPLQPVGISNSMIPLKSWEKEVLKRYEFRLPERGRVDARMTKVLWDECVSPRGTFVKFW